MSPKPVHIYPPPKNNIFEIHKTAISKNNVELAYTCGMSAKFIFRHKIQEKTTTLIYFLFFNVISHIADIIAVKVTGPLYHSGYLLLLHCSNLFSKICLTRTKLIRCDSSSFGDNFSSTAKDLFPFL